MIRFYIALYSSKFLLAILKILKKEQDDKPGLLAYRIDPNFLEHIKCPKITIAVTGTNGKTTVSNLISELLIKDGKKVAYNDWGANTEAGAARCLIDAVNIFNKPIKDIAVLETDELSSSLIFPFVKPTYIVVTNLFRDSMHRNASPDFVFKKIDDYIPDDTTLILNADDIISSNLGSKNKKIRKVFFGIEKQDFENKENNIVIDARVCPKCNNTLEYSFRRYHHIGRLHCPKCGFKSYDADYLAVNVDLNKELMTVKNKDNEDIYELASDSIFNTYNTLCVIALLRDLGLNNEKLKEYLKLQTIVKSRESKTVVNGISINTLACKGLNAVATSRVCHYLSKQTGNIEVIIVIDDTFDNQNGSEAIAWIYDSDFEALNKDNIKTIVIGGVRNKDYKLRLLLAGIDEKKIKCVKDEQETYKYLSLKNIDKVYILHEVYYITGAMKIKNSIKARVESEDIKNA